MTALVGGDVIANGVRLHSERSGGAKPPLVLAHGLSDDGRCWTPIVDALAGSFDIVTVDARGHGLSAAPEDGYRLGTLAEDLACVIRELGLERPVILGHSLGAVTAMALAGRYPDLPAAIVLEDPPPLWRHEGPMPDDAALSRSIAAGIVSLKRLSRDELRRQVVAQNPAWPEAEIGPWVEAKLAFSLRAVPLATPEHLASFDIRSVLGAITCPVTVLHGDALRGSMATVADLEILRTLVPQLVTVHVPGAGHSIRRDQPERYLDAVREAIRAS